MVAARMEPSACRVPRPSTRGLFPAASELEICDREKRSPRPLHWVPPLTTMRRPPASVTESEPTDATAPSNSRPLRAGRLLSSLPPLPPRPRRRLLFLSSFWSSLPPRPRRRLLLLSSALLSPLPPPLL